MLVDSEHKGKYEYKGLGDKQLYYQYPKERTQIVD